MIKEFREFITRGNVIDLAVGMVMGASFTAIVKSLVDSIIMPFIAGIAGKSGVETLFVKFNGSKIMYGEFLQAIIDFLLIAFVLFIVIKAINELKNLVHLEEKAEEVKDPTPTAEDYLREIRDLLQRK